MTQSDQKQLLWVFLFALSMAFFESSIVVYLRELYYPGGFDFPLKTLETDIAATEIIREAFSLLMIVSVAVIAGRKAMQRFGYFLIIFAVWDIFYYVFLKMVLGWPESFFEWDILFLIPVTWVGPVIAPAFNSLVMVVLGFILVRAVSIKSKAVIKPLSWTLLIVGAVFVLVSYVEDYVNYMNEFFTLQKILFDASDKEVMAKATEYVPKDFAWGWYIAGVVLHIAAVVHTWRVNEKKSD
ncbi:MAG: hypothetical protein K9I68_11490 [Bacteroidales bacterium]|nr:hypothetical protein [Bacteroidales bacterium]